MKVIDKSPIEKPAVGRIVTLKVTIGSMVDGCLYLLPGNETLASEVEEALCYLTERESKETYLNAYDFEALEDMEVFEGQVDLLGAIRDEEANLVMPLKTPHASSKQYLIVNANKDDLITKVSLMLYTSERISKHSYGEVLRQYAIDDPEEFCKTLEAQFDNQGLWTRVAQGVGAALSSILSQKVCLSVDA